MKTTKTIPERRGYYWRSIRGSHWTLLHLTANGKWKYASSGVRAEVGKGDETWVGPLKEPPPALTLDIDSEVE